MAVQWQHRAPLLGIDFAISLAEDWFDPLPAFELDGEALDFYAGTMRVYVRPLFDHSVLMLQIDSDTSTGARVMIDDAGGGLASIYVPRDDAIDALPVGEWEIFATFTFESVQEPQIIELFRGKLAVHAGRVDGSG